MTHEPVTDEPTPSEKLDQRIAELGDWRGEVLRRVREVVHRAVPDVVEQWKWVKPTNPGVPVWSSHGDLCTGEVYTKAVKLTFMKGASLPDPRGLFTSSLDGKVRRALDVTEGEAIDEEGLAELLRAAAALNAQKKGKG
ncbi:MAG: hypothetical protein JWN17_2743 [Frankiales bacterium]|nr:hypothetical protein [Frankiales bacterium]